MRNNVTTTTVCREPGWLSKKTFGMLANHFRCLLTTLKLHPTTVGKMVLASCILYNLLIERRIGAYLQPDAMLDFDEAYGNWIKDFLHIPQHATDKRDQDLLRV